MNEVTDFSQYEWADRVFTVYDKNYIKDHDVEINCGGRSCMSVYVKTRIKKTIRSS